MKDALVVFAKAPVPGRVKTRLGAHVGDELAAELHAAFLADVAATVSELPGVSRLLAYAGPPSHPGFGPMDDHGFRFVPQGDGDLGARMARITAGCFAEGARRVVVIGSDSPSLPVELVAEAYARLDEVDVVLGPSFDGGYYLVGMREPTPGVFEDIAWSTDQVLAQSLDRLRESSRLWDLLGFWYDVDDFDDLKFLRMHVLGHVCHHRPGDLPHTISLLRRLEAAGYFPGR